MTDPRFRVGLLGFGNAGRFFHAPLIQVIPGLELIAVVTTRAAVKQLYPDIEVLDSVEALLAKPDVDLVVVATPHQQHVPHTHMALEAGKHVVVEKPLAATSVGAMSLFDQAKAADRMLITYHNRRWDGDFLTVKKVVESGVLGEIYFYEAEWKLYLPTLRGVWRENPEELGGMLYDLGPHLIDQALILFGKPESVFAQIETHRPGGKVDDMFRLHIRFASGVNAVLGTDVLTPLPGPRFRVRGFSGTFEKYGLDPQETALRAGQLPEGAVWGVEDSSHWGRLWTTNLDGLSFDGNVPTVAGDYRKFYEAVYQALSSDQTSPVEPETVVLQLRVIEAALRSARTNTVQNLD
jgi:scyllo-inositol 2-dehydrogenase (NADP+)